MKTAVSIPHLLSGAFPDTYGGRCVLIQPSHASAQHAGDIFGDAELYLQVYVWGLVFLFLYNVCTGIFTALGDSRRRSISSLPLL